MHPATKDRRWGKSQTSCDVGRHAPKRQDQRGKTWGWGGGGWATSRETTGSNVERQRGSTKLGGEDHAEYDVPSNRKKVQMDVKKKKKTATIGRRGIGRHSKLGWVAPLWMDAGTTRKRRDNKRKKKRFHGSGKKR